MRWSYLKFKFHLNQIDYVQPADNHSLSKSTQNTYNVLNVAAAIVVVAHKISLSVFILFFVRFLSFRVFVQSECFFRMHAIPMGQDNIWRQNESDFQRTTHADSQNVERGADNVSDMVFRCVHRIASTHTAPW